MDPSRAAAAAAEGEEEGEEEYDEHVIAEVLLLADECLAEGLRLACEHVLGQRLLRRRGTARGIASLEGALGLVGALHLPTLRAYCR